MATLRHQRGPARDASRPMVTAVYQPGNGWARWNGGNVWVVPDVDAGDRHEQAN